GRLWTEAGRYRDPHAALAVDTGRVLADTTSTSGAFRPLDLVVHRALGNVTNTGAAWYSVDPNAVTVSTGKVTVAGAPATATESALSCGDGVPVEPPAAGPSESPSGQTPSELPVEITSSVPATV